MELLANFLMAIGQLLEFVLTILSLLYNSAYAGINNFLLKNDLPPKENTQITTNNPEIQTPIAIQNYPKPKESDTEGMNESKNAIITEVDQFVESRIRKRHAKVSNRKSLPANSRARKILARSNTEYHMPNNELRDENEESDENTEINKLDQGIPVTDTTEIDNIAIRKQEEQKDLAIFGLIFDGKFARMSSPETDMKDLVGEEIDESPQSDKIKKDYYKNILTDLLSKDHQGKRNEIQSVLTSKMEESDDTVSFRCKVKSDTEMINDDFNRKRNRNCGFVEHIPILNSEMDKKMHEVAEEKISTVDTTRISLDGYAKLYCSPVGSENYKNISDIVDLDDVRRNTNDRLEHPNSVRVKALNRRPPSNYRLQKIDLF